VTHSDWLPRIDRNLCIACGDCISACPVDALGTQSGKAALTKPGACTYCLACEDLCPTHAIELPFLIRFEPGVPRVSPRNALDEETPHEE